MNPINLDKSFTRDTPKYIKIKEGVSVEWYEERHYKVCGGMS